MKLSIVGYFLLFLVGNASGQDTNGVKRISIFDDTTLVPIPLLPVFSSNDRIIVFRTGNEASIYLSESRIRTQASKNLADEYDYTRENSKQVVQWLAQYKGADTIFAKGYPYYFKHLVSEELKKGNAKVFDEMTHSFVPSIYSRLERAISTADRVYYLPGRRHFFQSQEWSGLLPNEYMEIE